MLVIRLRRIGRIHDPHYRIVVAEHTSPVQGKFIAEVGHYHPKSKELVIHKDTFMDWLGKGAKPSNTVARLAERSQITHDHIVVIERHGKPKKKAQEAAAARAEGVATPVAEAPTEDATPAETESETETTEALPEEVTEAPSNETPEEAPADTDTEEAAA